jgi:hypothetical protein
VRSWIVVLGVSLALSAWLAARGFVAISDDDFSRTVIAQALAEHVPSWKVLLDPSRTSWLPLPFWLTGAVQVFGPSFALARVTSALLTAATSVGVLRALEHAGVSPRHAFLGVLLAMLNPWHLFASAAAVPEAYTANLVAIAVIGLASAEGPTMWHAAALIAATLCRYEPWLLALPFAGITLETSLRSQQRRSAWITPASLLGPLVWIAWNGITRDSPFNFYHRVSNYKAAYDAATGGAGSHLASLWHQAPEVLLLVPMLALLFLRARRPAIALLSMCALLLLAELKNGAPTHHGERVWLPAMTAALAFLPHALQSATPWKQHLGTTVLALLFVVRLLAPLPFDSSRAALVKQGEALRDAPRVTITRCAYEHYAVMAGYGYPSRVTELAAEPNASACPRVERR